MIFVSAGLLMAFLFPKQWIKFLRFHCLHIPGKTGRNLLLLEIGPKPVPDWWTVGIRGENELLFADFDGERISLADEKWKMMPRVE